MPSGYELERLNQQYLQGEILNKFADSDIMHHSTDYQESATSPKKFLTANQGRITTNISNNILSRLNTSFDVRSNSYMPGFGVASSVQKLHHRPLTQQAIYGSNEPGAHTSGRSPKQSLEQMSS